MKKLTIRLAWILLLLASLVIASCSVLSPAKNQGSQKQSIYLPQVAGGQAAGSYADPFAYCAAVGTIAKPDASYTGEAVPDSIILGYKKAAGLESSTEPSDMWKKATIWRCMNKQVYACNFGANLPCDSKANTSQTPTQAMADFCKENQNSDFIPMAVTGHDTIFAWKCSGDQPQVDKQVSQVDEAGYIKEIWYQIQQ
jgi:hypothetical protein